MNKKSGVFYSSWKKAVDRWGDEKRGELYAVILDYMFDGIEPATDDPLKLTIFDMVKEQIDVNNQRYENGKKGGRPKQNQIETKAKPKQNQTETKAKANDNVNDNVNVNSNIIKRTAKKFSKPSVEEVREYCNERRNGIDPQSFIDFYQSKDWMIGKNKMKDWKAAIRNWETRRTNAQRFKPVERDYDMDALEIKLRNTN